MSKGYIKRVVEKMREKWQDEDMEIYVTQENFDVLQEQVDSNRNFCEDLNVQIADLEKMQIKGQVDNEAQNQLLIDKTSDLQKQIIDLMDLVASHKQEGENALEATAAKFDRKVEQQFNDFMLKVDGELTRRNRLRTETFNKFDEQEALILRCQHQIDQFKLNEQRMLGTLSKLAYSIEMQSALNIQDELDRSWVSLFGKIEERTGGR